MFATKLYAEAVAQRLSVKKMFLKISQNSQESICARVTLLIKVLKKMFLIKRLNLKVH